MNDIVKFEFENTAVRTVVVDGEPWWVAKDVCEVLGLSNVSEATEAGKAYGRLYDTQKLHAEGTPVEQLKWLASVIEVLKGA